MTIMVIQCGCLDMMRAEDGKLHSQLEWPKAAYFHNPASSLKSRLGGRHFQPLYRHSKLTHETWVLAMADAFNDHFFQLISLQNYCLCG